MHHRIEILVVHGLDIACFTEPHSTHLLIFVQELQLQALAASARLEPIRLDQVNHYQRVMG